MTDSLYRLYLPHECGLDDYPYAWHRTIKHAVREEAGHRCRRCHHPYTVGETPGKWSPCDEQCRHGGPIRWSNGSSWEQYDGSDETIAQYVEAQWRVLTVHHICGVKADCRWWNLVALCQRYWPEHTAWFKPYAAGWYAVRFLDEDLTREEVEARLEELLALEHRQLALGGPNAGVKS